MSNSTIFIGNLTQIDFAYINPFNQTIEGGSLNMDVEVSGPIDTQEEVVVDFGTVKRTIKDLIDGRRGYDHKLWVLPDVGTQADIMNNWSDPSSKKVLMYERANRAVIVTPKLSIKCPKDAVRVCKYDSIKNLECDMEDYLEEQLATLLYRDGSSGPITVRVTLHKSPILPYNNSEYGLLNFRYTHGLKNSTSWGCQNIAHGHESWLLFLDGSNRVVDIDGVFREKIIDELHNHILIWRDNIVYESKTHLDIEYQSERGLFSMSISKADCRYQVIDTETTVEHLVDWFCAHFKEEVSWMRDKGARKLYLSEGLVKGSCCRI